MSLAGTSAVFRLQLFPYAAGATSDFYATLPAASDDTAALYESQVTHSGGPGAAGAVQSPATQAAGFGSESTPQTAIPPDGSPDQQEPNSAHGSNTNNSQAKGKHGSSSHFSIRALSAALHHGSSTAASSAKSGGAGHTVVDSPGSSNGINGNNSNFGNRTPMTSTNPVHTSGSIRERRQKWVEGQQDTWLRNQFAPQQFVFPPVEVDLHVGGILRIGRKVDRHHCPNGKEKGHHHHHHHKKASLTNRNGSTPLEGDSTQGQDPVKDDSVEIKNSTGTDSNELVTCEVNNKTFPCTCYFHNKKAFENYQLNENSKMNENERERYPQQSPRKSKLVETLSSNMDDVTPINTTLISADDTQTRALKSKKIQGDGSACIDDSYNDIDNVNITGIINNKVKRISNVAYGKEVCDLDINNGAASILYTTGDSTTHISDGPLYCECKINNGEVIDSTTTCECCLSRSRPACCANVKSMTEPCKDMKIRRAIDYVAFKSKVVSRGHVEIWVGYDGLLYIRDIGSSSGTFVNRLRLSPANKVSPPFELASGDVVQLGVDYQNRAEEIYKCVMMRVFFSMRPAKAKKVNKIMMQKALEMLIASNNPHIDQELYENSAAEAIDETMKNKGVSPKKSSRKALKIPEQDTDCAICLCTLSPQQALFLAPCSHCFHFKCIVPLFTAGHVFSCPLCRQVSNLDASVADDDAENASLVNGYIGVGTASTHRLSIMGSGQMGSMRDGALNSGFSSESEMGVTNRFAHNGFHMVKCTQCGVPQSVYVDVPVNNNNFDSASLHAIAPGSHFASRDNLAILSGGYSSTQSGTSPQPLASIPVSIGSANKSFDRRSIHSIASSHIGKVTAREDLAERMSIKSSTGHGHGGPSSNAGDETSAGKTTMSGEMNDIQFQLKIDTGTPETGTNPDSQQQQQQQQQKEVHKQEEGDVEPQLQSQLQSHGTGVNAVRTSSTSSSGPQNTSVDPITSGEYVDVSKAAGGVGSDSESVEYESDRDPVHEGELVSTSEEGTPVEENAVEPAQQHQQQHNNNSNSAVQHSSGEPETDVETRGSSPTRRVSHEVYEEFEGSDDEGSRQSHSTDGVDEGGKRKTVLKRGTTRVNRRLSGKRAGSGPTQ